ncbi:hypothetical protein EJ05DRAFT_473582 [Pseudovirgaria hyperparasitica]|uniref:Uncharacterized protein n=1 Tax=Pseudovirgaria hyperparasitica TaxID=470096 RepID=A0A6A6WH90_9PEZI|nr:uncharacterized protein EJ05DRAFT_473582 [Pseudovirgaria hyperparasitica]KAF2761017.1 hypothetical protein EJ05DRAFT_473582 [Pseudovirgaria hyperparasitica]
MFVLDHGRRAGSQRASQLSSHGLGIDQIHAPPARRYAFKSLPFFGIVRADDTYTWAHGLLRPVVSKRSSRCEGRLVCTVSHCWKPSVQDAIGLETLGTFGCVSRCKQASPFKAFRRFVAATTCVNRPTFRWLQLLLQGRRLPCWNPQSGA